MDMDRWIKSAAYLPPPLRDFHDQKDLFKTIHDTTAVEKHAYAGEIGWMSGQCYVIDIFLWWMAKRGYTLQRSRQKLPFRSLESDVSASIAEQRRTFSALFERNQQPRDENETGAIG